MKYLIALLLLTSTAQADAIIVYHNKCLDADWTCRNKTQAADKTNIRVQVYLACSAMFCPVIHSVDPWRPDENTWQFGARVKRGKILFAADPTCPHSRRQLRALVLRRSK